MRRILVDSEDTIIYEGADANQLLFVLNKETDEVTEEDEVRWEKELRNISWKGKLRYEVHFNLKFKGIDDWNRPVFKDVDGPHYFGSTNKLYGYDEFQKSGLQFFKEHPEELEYFGSSFNCEPIGSRQEFFKFNFVE